VAFKTAVTTLTPAGKGNWRLLLRKLVVKYAESLSFALFDLRFPISKTLAHWYAVQACPAKCLSPICLQDCLQNEKLYGAGMQRGYVFSVPVPVGY